MSIELVPLKCPKCGSVLKARRKDLVYRCENCGTFVYAPTGEVMNVKILNFEVPGQGKKYYMPFLMYHTHAEIYNEEVRGFFAERGMGGEWITYIPAGGQIPGEEVVRISKTVTSKPPHGPEIDSFREGSPLPVEISVEEGEKIAEFVFLSYEVDRPGILQDLKYSFSAKFKGITYLPVYYQQGYVIALREY